MNKSRIELEVGRRSKYLCIFYMQVCMCCAIIYMLYTSYEDH